MTPRQLTYFLRIADLGSFTRAAAVLHVAQPALSRQIKQLEDDLGVVLFARSDTGIRLTEAGVMLAERARVLLLQFESVRSEVGALATTVQGRLHVGMPPSLFDLVTVPLVTRYRTDYPAVHLGVTEGISSTLYQMVAAGELDMGWVLSTELMPGLEQQPMIKEQLFLAYPNAVSMDLDADGCVSLEQVARHPLVLTRWPNALRVLLDDTAQARGLKITSLFDSNSSRLMVKAVASGLGCTVNTYSALYESHRCGSIRIAPIHGLSKTWTLIHSRDRGMSMAGRKLAELVTRIASERIAAGLWRGAFMV